jgi:alkaline phosphatase
MKMSKITAVFLLTICTSFGGLNAGLAQQARDNGLHRLPKYVFFFLGDGMASAHIQSTEAYLTVLNGGSDKKAEDLLKPENRLNMSRMFYSGMQTTYDSFALMTDSASSATAFASGIKTRSGTIGMDNTATRSYKSVARLAKEMGMKVGVISSVSLDHATPAAYYASVPNRGYMNNIAAQLATSGYDFFGGGGLVCPTGACRGGDTSVDIWKLLKDNGYAVLNTGEEIRALKGAPRDRVVCINPKLQDSQAMPYAIDMDEEEYADNLSLAEMTEVAIASLFEGRRGQGRGNGSGSDRGFFLMVEGGKIDWASHANDAMATIGDMIDFDNAVGAAMEFYRQHPNETLIVVTGDHETGGMSVGHATTGYTAYYDRLLDQRVSFTHFGQDQWARHKEAYAPGYDWSKSDNLAQNPDMKNLMLDLFGLNYDGLNAYQKEKLEDAYDQSMAGHNSNNSAENSYLYGGYEPIIVTITHILNERASIGWTSYSHTGVPVPVFAEGQQGWRFSGFYDNTDIARQLARAIGFRGELPVAR